MTPQPNGQPRGTAMPGTAVRAPAGTPSAAQRPRTDPWPGQPAAQGRPRQPGYPPQYGQPQQGQPVPQPGRPPQYGAHQQPGRPPQYGAPQQGARTQPVQKAGAGRRWLGLLAFVVLAGLSLPVHVLALFFAFVEFASPGDATTAILLVIGAFAGSFAALLVTAIISQLIGGFPSRWRVRITFAVTNAVLALGVALIASLTLF